jgi:hypothetical protein
MAVLLLLLLSSWSSSWSSFVFLFKFFCIANLGAWFWISVSNQNFTDGFLLKLQYLDGHSLHLQRPTCLVTLLCVTVPSSIHLMSWKYGLLLRWQQNRSKATMWLLHSIRVKVIFWVCVANYCPTTPTEWHISTGACQWDLLHL